MINEEIIILPRIYGFEILTELTLQNLRGQHFDDIFTFSQKSTQIIKQVLIIQTHRSIEGYRK